MRTALFPQFWIFRIRTGRFATPSSIVLSSSNGQCPLFKTSRILLCETATGSKSRMKYRNLLITAVIMFLLLFCFLSVSFSMVHFPVVDHLKIQCTWFPHTEWWLVVDATGYRLIFQMFYKFWFMQERPWKVDNTFAKMFDLNSLKGTKLLLILCLFWFWKPVLKITSCHNILFILCGFVCSGWFYSWKNNRTWAGSVWGTDFRGIRSRQQGIIHWTGGCGVCIFTWTNALRCRLVITFLFRVIGH